MMACHLKLGDIIIDDETGHNMIVTLNCMVLFRPYVQSTMSCHMTGFEFLLKQIHIQESMNSSQTRRTIWIMCFYVSRKPRTARTGRNNLIAKFFYNLDPSEQSGGFRIFSLIHLFG